MCVKFQTDDQHVVFYIHTMPITVCVCRYMCIVCMCSCRPGYNPGSHFSHDIYHFFFFSIQGPSLQDWNYTSNIFWIASDILLTSILSALGLQICVTMLCYIYMVFRNWSEHFAIRVLPWSLKHKVLNICATSLNCRVKYDI